MGRLIGSVLLLLGMAAMHHLAVSGCGSVMVDHASPGVAAHAAVHLIEHPDSGVAGETQDPRDDGETSGTGTPVDHSGAALCLAVIVSAWLLTPLLRFRRVPSALSSPLRKPPTMVAVLSRPPDLSLLSVSRT